MAEPQKQSHYPSPARTQEIVSRTLSIFVDKHTTKALRSSNPADLDVLININREVAAGLRASS